MTDFQTLPLKRCIALIYTWLNLPWPVTAQQGHEVALSLGWRTVEQGPEYYASELSAGAMDSYVTTYNEMLDSVFFPLMVRRSKEERDAFAPLTLAFYESLVKELRVLYGRPKRGKGRNYQSAEWTLPSGASLSLNNYDIGCDVYVSSPARNAILDDPASDPNPDETDL